MFDGTRRRLQDRFPRIGAVATAARRADVPFLAHAIAFKALAALLPLAVVVLSLVSVLGGDRLATDLADLGGAALPGPSRELILGAIRAELAAPATSLVSLAVLGWGSLSLFRGLQRAFGIVYDAKTAVSSLQRFRDAVVALGSVVLGAGAVALAVGLPRLIGSPVVDAVAPVVLAGVLVVVLVPSFVLVPAAPVTIREAVPGAVVTALGWTGLHLLFGVYLAVAQPGRGGIFGGILVLLTWLYLASLLALVGAVVNAVLADYRPTPGDGASGLGASSPDEPAGSERPPQSGRNT